MIMPIDRCGHSFEQLANVAIPKHLTAMRERLDRPHPMAWFIGGKVAALRALGMAKDVSGCYVIVSRGRPIYVGISRSVVKRLGDHVKGKSHFSATLAYRMAARKPHGMSRTVAMADAEFRAHFERNQKLLRAMHVAIIEIDCPVELYCFELAAAMEFDTHQWNSFKMH